MFGRYAKGAETPRFRRGTEPPRPCRSLRPCLADGKPATFHRWVEEETAVLHLGGFLRQEEQKVVVKRFREDGVIDAYSKMEKVRTCSALVEYPDGSVGRVKPELITFIDRKEG